MADLSIRDLVIEYRTGDGGVVRPIYGLNMQVPAGSLVAVVGPSGCGKTSLMSCIGGILRATSGEIRFGATDVTKLNARGLTDYRRRSVGIVFQSFNLVASLTAMENVMVPLWAEGKTHWVAQQRARDLLTQVGLHDRMEHRPGKLSGGQQQRVAVARAVALEPPLILADEPTAQLDQNRAGDVMALLQSLAGGDRVVVVSTHDTRFLPLADLVIDLGLHTAPIPAPPRTVRLGPGSVLLDRGGVEDLIYIVAAGEVEVTQGIPGIPGGPDGDRGLLRIVGPDRYTGPLGPVFPITPPAKVHAQTSSTLMSFTVPQFHHQFGSLPNGV